MYRDGQIFCLTIRFVCVLVHAVVLVKSLNAFKLIYGIKSTTIRFVLKNDNVKLMVRVQTHTKELRHSFWIKTFKRAFNSVYTKYNDIKNYFFKIIFFLPSPGI